MFPQKRNEGKMSIAPADGKIFTGITTKTLPVNTVRKSHNDSWQAGMLALPK